MVDVWSENGKKYGAATLCCCLCLMLTKTKENVEVQCYTCAELLCFMNYPNQSIYLWFSQIFKINKNLVELEVRGDNQ